MNPAYIWSVILGMTAVTLITRAFFLFAGSRVKLPERVQRALRYAPAAALAAVVVPDVLTWHDALSISLSNHQMLAALAGLLWFLLRRSMVETIVFGMLVFTALRWWA
jgi:branched-subunit amino acid transport protein